LLDRADERLLADGQNEKAFLDEPCAWRVRHIRRRPAAVLVSANSAGMSRDALCRNWKIKFTSSVLRTR
jgi:hypothetical protein